MDIFFADQSEVPLPPDEVRIREFTADPWSDGRRVKIYLEVTPFQKRPSGEVVITNEEGRQVASANIVETINPKMEINMHLREAETGGEYTASVNLFYLQEIEMEGEDEQQGEETLVQPERMPVDQAEATFVID